MSAQQDASLGRVVVLGAHIVDVLGRPVSAIPSGQGSARLEEIRVTAAGTAAGTGVDLAKLGADVLCVGAIGADLLGDLLVAALRAHGADPAGLVRKPGVQTSATILPIRPNGERPALHVPGATSKLTLADIDLAAISQCRALVIGGPDALGEQATGWLPEVAAAARAGGALVFVDTLHQGSPRDLRRIAGLLAYTDWFAPNADQLHALTGRADIGAAVSDVRKLGAAGVAVTLGAAGCLVTTESGELAHIDAIAVDVVDTTGCGDGFNAGMVAGLLLGEDPVRASRLGVACGSLVATGLGSDAGIVSLEQVRSFQRSAAGPAAGPAFVNCRPPLMETPCQPRSAS